MIAITGIVAGEAHLIDIAVTRNCAQLATGAEENQMSSTNGGIVIDTDPGPSTEAGGSWWDVGVPEVSERAEVKKARADYEANEASERNIPV